jgi:hypothetical protein
VDKSMALVSNPRTKKRDWKTSLITSSKKRPLSLALRGKISWLKKFSRYPAFSESINFPNKKAYCNYILLEAAQLSSTSQIDPDWRYTKMLNVELKIDKLKSCITEMRKVKRCCLRMPNTPLLTGFPLRLTSKREMAA